MNKHISTYLTPFHHDHSKISPATGSRGRQPQPACDWHTLQAQLNQHNIASHHDKIAYDGLNDPRYRVFVTGKTIFAAKELLGDVPIKD